MVWLLSPGVSVIFTLVPYIYTCAALLVLGHGHLGNAKGRYIAIMLIAFLYSLWAIVGSNAQQVLWSFVIVLATSATYAVTYNRSHPAAFPLDPSDPA